MLATLHLGQGQSAPHLTSPQLKQSAMVINKTNGLDCGRNQGSRLKTETSLFVAMIKERPVGEKPKARISDWAANMVVFIGFPLVFLQPFAR